MSTTAPIPDSPRFISVAQPTTLAEELLDQIGVFRPLGTRIVDTERGETSATLAAVLRVNDDGTVTDFGERLIFWTVVQDQLRGTSAESPWVAGRLVRGGRAYKLAPLSAGEEEAVTAALDRYHT